MTVVARLNDVKDKEDNIDHIPDAESAQCNELADSNACVSDAATIDGEYAQEYRIQKCRHEILIGVS